MVSFIISIDTTFGMADNFFNIFMSNNFVKSSEVVVVVDGNYDIRIRNLLSTLKKGNPNLIVIYSEKLGYGKANNLAVKHSSGEYLFFINSDIFAEENCYEKMLSVLENETVDCVQPLLIYPQSNLVQCAGTFFGPYFKDHLFDGNRIDATIVAEDGPRQALTSALYAMKRSTFEEFEGFDEFYYNKLESFELSYKLHLAGKTCWYLGSAKAWHSRGGGRSLYTYDFKQQEAYFWSRFGSQVKPDISSYINMQVTQTMRKQYFRAIMMSQIRSWKKIFENINLCIDTYTEMPWIGTGAFNLWDVFPNAFLNTSAPFLLIVENIRYLRNNKYWFELRNNPNDIAVDRFANLVNIKQYLS